MTNKFLSKVASRKYSCVKSKLPSGAIVPKRTNKYDSSNLIADNPIKIGSEEFNSSTGSQNLEKLPTTTMPGLPIFGATEPQIPEHESATLM